MKITYLIPIFLLGFGMHAQTGINELLAAGIDDAKQFSDDYFSPAAEGVMYALSNAWYNSAKSKKPGHVELSIIGNASFVNDEDKSFTLNVADYNYLRFMDPAQQSGEVATALGENDPDITMIIEYENELGITEEVEIELPQGIGSTGINLLPTAYLQLGVGVFKGTEVKVRYLPKIDQGDVEVQLYGGALQHELTSWIPGAGNLPIAIGVLVGYTHFEAGFNLEDNSVVEGDNQKIESEVNSLMVSALVSTKLPVINFYAGLGYLSGNAQSDLLGTYHIQTGVLGGTTIKDPYSIENKVSGVKATLGTKLKLGFFRLHADYSFQRFSNASVGISFGF
ncbi:MAG TPA: DUF6588 family protein [Flavobacteriaceae bacterium]|nr:DUF6588 family protein [Flavobacteriaceae bacterium]